MQMQQLNNIAYVTGPHPFDADKPTLVFIHGSGGSHVLWENQIDAFAGCANTVALDLPGHGRSIGPGMARIEAYARAVAGFIEASGAPHPIPCGLSIGGAIVQQLLLDDPDLFPAGILVSTGARLRVMPAIFETIEKDYDGFLALIGQLAASVKTDPACLQSLLEASAFCPPQVTAGDFRACDGFDVSDCLGQIDASVLVVSAADDKLTPPKYGAFLEEKIKGARRVVIADAGHLVPMEKPVEFNRAVKEFVGAIDFF